MKKISLFLAVLLALSALALPAAESPLAAPAGADPREIPVEAGEPTPQDSHEQPVDGGRIFFGSIGEASNLISYLTTDAASHEVAELLFVAPLRYNKDLEPEPWAAERWSMEDGGKRMRFTLRKGILWEDGTELTAEDVAFTVRVVTDPATASPYAEDFSRIRELKVLDRYTFEAVYDEFFARAVASWMSPILPKHILEGQNIRNTPFSRRPVGAGPYRLKAWDAGSSITLAASPTYFGGRPHIDEAVYRIIPDDATMFMETRAGRLDVMNLSPLQYLRQTSGPMWEQEFHKYRYLASVYVFLGFNLEHPFFKDVRVRRALSLAIDRHALVKGVLLGQGVAAFGPYKPGSWAAHPTLRPVVQDVAEARRLLAEAGFTPDADGMLRREGRPFAFSILTNQGNEQRILTATLIQSQLRAIGVDARIRTVEWAAFIREFVHKGRFDAVILGWTIPQDPDIFQIWHSSQAHDGGLNFIHYMNPQVDALLEEARSAPERKKRAALYARVQEILAEEQPYCFLFVPYALPVVQRRFMGIEPALAGIMYNFEKWWVPKALQRHALAP